MSKGSKGVGPMHQMKPTDKGPNPSKPVMGPVRKAAGGAVNSPPRKGGGRNC